MKSREIKTANNENLTIFLITQYQGYNGNARNFNQLKVLGDL